MKEIPNISLSAFLTEALAQAEQTKIETQKKALSDFLLKQLTKKDSLILEAEKLEKQLSAKRTEITKVDQLLEKVHSGDWSSIKEDGKGQAQVKDESANTEKVA